MEVSTCRDRAFNFNLANSVTSEQVAAVLPSKDLDWGAQNNMTLDRIELLQKKVKVTIWIPNSSEEPEIFMKAVKSSIPL